MKKRTAIILVSVLTLIAAIQLSSCEKYVLPELSLSPDTIFFSASGGTQEMIIHTNVIWEIKDENIPDWVTVDTDYGEGEATVKITVPETDQSDQRQSPLTVSSEVLEKSLTIIQAASDLTIQ